MNFFDTKVKDYSRKTLQEMTLCIIPTLTQSADQSCLSHLLEISGWLYVLI